MSEPAAPIASDTIRGSTLLSEAADLLAKGRRDAASMKVVEHLRRHRDDPRGLALLGKIALDNGALGQAEHFLRRAVALGDGRYETRLDLASAILRQDILDEALAAYTALEQENDDPNLTSTRALIFDRLGRHEEAIAAHEKALAARPADSRYRILYGHSLRFAGRTDDAIAVYRQVVDEDPERGEGWWALVDIKTNSLTDEDTERMEEALGYAIDPLNLVPLHKALARSLHDRGRYEEAWEHYAAGNRIRAEATRYDPGELTQDVDQFIALTERFPLPAPAPAPQGSGPTPIFLVSLPRSGSTLLEQILDQHPEIEARGELPYVRSMMRQALELHIRKGVKTVPQLLQAMSPQERGAMGSEYLRRAAIHQREEGRYFIDKMPSNWSDIPFIRAILPHARFIAIRRNALDCCLSNHFHHFGAAHAASYDLVTQGRAYVDFVRLIDHLKANSPAAIAVVRYEELVESPERNLRDILAHLRLEWDESLLQFHEKRRNIRTPSAEQVRQPLNRKGFGTWRHYDQWLGPLRDALGEYADD